MTTPTQTELFQQLTDLMPEGKVPKCWNGQMCWFRVNPMPDATQLFHVMRRVESGQPIGNDTSLEPSLDQLFSLLEAEGYWYWAAKDDDGYHCRILPLPPNVGKAQVFYGPTLLYVITQACVRVMEMRKQ